jgi:GNAT superfamily N-acetyltransferase
MRARAIASLRDGLLLRRATAADAAQLVALNARLHGAPPHRPGHAIGIWTQDLLTRPHPTFGDGGFLVVEDPASGMIVSSLNLIPQTWSYGDVRFGVGRVELVGTLPEYRRRGLIRRQMEEIHRWSDDLGHPAQVITGIARFYRQFGYEQALAMGGGRGGVRQQIPALPAGEREPFRVRPATAADAEFLAEVEALARPRSLLSVPRDADLWRYELDGMSDGHRKRHRIAVVEVAGGGPRPAGKRVGYLVHQAMAAPTVTVLAYELLPGVSWLDVTPGVLRSLGAAGDASLPAGPEDVGRRFDCFRFQLGTEHPVYDAIPRLLPLAERPDMQYVRVADVPAFLRRVAPVLERRLAASVAVGHTGSLRLSFFGDGVRLRFEGGRLTGVESCPHHAPGTTAGPPDAFFPDLTFLGLLFGARSLDELEQAIDDCRAVSAAGVVLLKALFPRQPSQLWPIS